MRPVLLGLLFVLLLALQQLHERFPIDSGSRSALAFGFLLLAGFVAGELIARWSIPRITAYLLAGMACGPFGLGLVDGGVLASLELVDDLALVLIAYTAGGELRLAALRERARAIGWITMQQTTLVFLAVGASLWALSPWLPLCRGLAGGQVLAVAAILAIIATANSPATTVAVIVEARARGPMTDVVLGVTVLKDIVVLVGFSLVLALVAPRALAGGGEGMGWLALALVASLAVGLVFGALMIGYLRFVGRQKVLFVIGAAFLLLSLARAFGLHELLVAVAAGFAVTNFSRQGEAFLAGLESASAPVFLIFFSLAGAALDLSVLAALWLTALLFIGLRTLFTWAGTGLGARLARQSPVVCRWAWTGFLGQAGVSLGLAGLARSHLPGFGPALADVVVGAVVIHQLVGPVAFRWALIRAGEAGARGASTPPSPRPDSEIGQ